MNKFQEVIFNSLSGVVSTIKSKLAPVSFSGKLSDATNDMSFRPILQVTQEEYDELPDSKNSDGKLYAISDGGAPEDVKYTDAAENILYDNSKSGLKADNVQAAIDELNTGLKVRVYTDPNYFVNFLNGCTGVENNLMVSKCGNVVSLYIVFDFPGSSGDVEILQLKNGFIPSILVFTNIRYNTRPYLESYGATLSLNGIVKAFGTSLTAGRYYLSATYIVKDLT